MLVPATIIIIASALIAIVAEYVPGFQGQNPKAKQRWMLGSIFVVVAGTFALCCLGYLSGDNCMICDIYGGIDALVLFVLSVAANQGIHFGTKSFTSK